MNMKILSDITPEDFSEWPIWQFASDLDDTESDTQLRPVKKWPVRDLSNRIVGTRVLLNSGEKCWAILGNIDLRNKRATEQFLTVSIERNSKWFDLARYHDVDHARRGPRQLAEFLDLASDLVFPIAYDISAVAHGLPEVVAGYVLPHPPETLSKAELIELSLN